MAQVMAHIANPLCVNPDCPNLPNVVAESKKSQDKPNTAIGHPNSVWKAELRVRYIPENIKELYETDRVTCNFLFDQVKHDYIQMNMLNIDQDTAIQLCCLAIRHYYRDANQQSDKKHVDYIEKEVGFSNFIPKSVIDNVKQKNLKKIIHTCYKKVYNFTDSEYMLKYFELLRTTQFNYEQEQFVVTLGSGWNIPVDLVIGPHIGM